MREPIKTEYRIEADCRPFRAALLCDLHDGDPRRAIELLRQDPPDLILIAGDLYESPPRNPFSYANALSLLQAIGGLAPILYARGNHDLTSLPEIDCAMREAGVTELDSSAVSVCGILVGGIRSAHYTGKVPDLAFLDRFEREPGFKLLLCHHPEYYPRYIRERKIDLTVSGHAHGGQWSLFGRGLFAPDQGLFPKYTRGVHEGRLVVSRGLSNSIRLPRIFTPTELLYLTVGR